MNPALTNRRNKINAQKFALWAAMASISMMFAAFLSAYIVKQASGNWLEFTLPATFYISTLLVVSVSLMLHKTQGWLREGKKSAYTTGLSLAMVLALIFIMSQYFSWTALVDRGIDLKGNVSGSFLYLITGIHVLHVLGGIIALVISLVYALFFPFNNGNSKRQKFDLVVNYWHFVDALWVVLFLFLMFYK